jgi:hypothetical protein
MALSGLDRRIQYIQDEIEDVTHELEGHKRQFEMLRREVLHTRSLTFSPRAKSPPTPTPRKPKKKPMGLREELLRYSTGVREYEYRKKLKEEERLREVERLEELELRRREEIERREFEIRKANRLAELEELGQTSKLAIRMLEFRLAELVEEYERLTMPRSKGETTGRGRKTSRKQSNKTKKNKI